MPNWLQYLLVLTAVGAAGLYLAKQAWNALTGRRSRLGSCCPKGCSALSPKASAAAPPVAFFPVEMLGRRK